MFDFYSHRNNHKVVITLNLFSVSLLLIVAKKFIVCFDFSYNKLINFQFRVGI